MKVLLVNTNGRTGGAAIAASRLIAALNNNGVLAKMLVANNDDCKNPDIVSLPRSWKYKWHFLAERLSVFVRQNFRKTHLFDIDPAQTGVDITRTPIFQEADIVHLHWVNQGFLSLKSIERILASGKPVVWTMHDMWAFTGICHYVRRCENYKHGCGNCPLLFRRGAEDLSNAIWKRKQALWSRFPNLTFVACSEWLAQTAEASPLLENHRVLDKANPIDCSLYAPHDQTKARQEFGLPTEKRKLILFCAYNVLLPIKGLTFLKQALKLLVAKRPELKGQLGLVLAGKGSEGLGEDFPIEVYPMGLVTDERRKASLYCATDIFAITSLQDNLPNTIVEAKASGLPVVGTKVGGIPQMINQEIDGCLVSPGDPTELAEALEWMLCEANLSKMANHSRLDALSKYSEETVAKKYIECYRNMLAEPV